MCAVKIVFTMVKTGAAKHPLRGRQHSAQLKGDVVEECRRAPFLQNRDFRNT